MTNKKIIEEFREWAKYGNENPALMGKGDAEFFILKALSRQKEEFKRVIEGIIPRTKPLGDLTGNDTKYFEFGYEQFRADILKAIEKL